MEQPSITSEARSIAEQVDTEHDVQSDSVFRHHADNSSTDSPEAYLLECSELLLQLSRGDRRHVDDELLSILQRASFCFSTFPEVLKNQKHCSEIISRRSNGDVMNAVFVQEFFEGKTVGRNIQPVLHQKDIVEILRKQVLLAGKEDVTFRSRHNGRGAAWSCYKLQAV